MLELMQTVMDDLHFPTINEITNLLLLCAPKDVLTELELSEDDFGVFCGHDFYECTGGGFMGNQLRIEIIAFALHHANKNTRNYLKSRHITKSLYIEQAVIHELVKMAYAEGEYDEYELTIKLDNEAVASWKSEISKKRSEIAKSHKHKKYYAEQKAFIEDLYK
ncbi:MAG: hypothetical protein PHU14_04700 [Methylovulum sp.]|nr:hypothetical protein [Methylovulum sp.]